jgi:mRNA-degrading endonuclease toxin of MazEF toxin-antitoxin module
MAVSVQFGQIVWAELADANGVRKLRPAVVVTPTDRISPLAPLEVVAVSGGKPCRSLSVSVHLTQIPEGVVSEIEDNATGQNAGAIHNPTRVKWDGQEDVEQE